MVKEKQEKTNKEELSDNVDLKIRKVVSYLALMKHYFLQVGFDKIETTQLIKEILSEFVSEDPWLEGKIEVKTNNINKDLNYMG